MDRVSQFVMGYGGIRGAVTYSLVILLDGKHVKGRNMMITAAITLIFFTCFIQVRYQLLRSKRLAEAAIRSGILFPSVMGFSLLFSRQSAGATSN